MKLFRIFVSTVLLLSLLNAGSASAMPKGENIGRDQAIAIVKDRFEGKVLKVQLKEKAKVSFYKVKFLTKAGRVRVLRVDSRTGELLKAGK